jgi:hypothetical protein
MKNFLKSSVRTIDFKKMLSFAQFVIASVLDLRHVPFGSFHINAGRELEANQLGFFENRAEQRFLVGHLRLVD